MVEAVQNGGIKPFCNLKPIGEVIQSESHFGLDYFVSV